ncbi:MAG TPA: SGNH/GDSL hydrolase family protein [Ktedonobacterales bacterium]|jgi:lysophospholipase L1-like esterase|nr:SGNH/GDSL hydrolase family protein [Ktedonobacterales bacterium]
MRELHGRWLQVLLVAVLIVGLTGVSLAVLMRDRGSASVVPQSPYIVYFVGDSITEGFTATSWKDTYRFQVGAYLRQKRGFNVVETGVWHGGWRASDALKALAVAPPAADTRLVVLEIGTNDSIHTHSPATFQAEYIELVAQLHAAAPRAALLCLSVWGSAAIAQSYNDFIRPACSGGRYVDITSLYANPANREPGGKPTFLGQPTDTFHPNNAGHAAIASAVAASMAAG